MYILLILISYFDYPRFFNSLQHVGFCYNFQVFGGHLSCVFLIIVNVSENNIKYVFKWVLGKVALLYYLAKLDLNKLHVNS